ncbi:MAG: hypothetical protein BGO07_02280 [Alphaproteobacteria bacterium 40-19]|nr:MAG: hypothetical protein BGO07_02280 [Alphaproteobacteria bacterium 40-19]
MLIPGLALASPDKDGSSEKKESPTSQNAAFSVQNLEENIQNFYNDINILSPTEMEQAETILRQAQEKVQIQKAKAFWIKMIEDTITAVKKYEGPNGSNASTISKNRPQLLQLCEQHHKLHANYCEKEGVSIKKAPAEWSTESKLQDALWFYAGRQDPQMGQKNAEEILTYGKHFGAIEKRESNIHISKKRPFGWMGMQSMASNCKQWSDYDNQTSLENNKAWDLILDTTLIGKNHNDKIKDLFSTWFNENKETVSMKLPMALKALEIITCPEILEGGPNYITVKGYGISLLEDAFKKTLSEDDKENSINNLYKEAEILYRFVEYAQNPESALAEFFTRLENDIRYHFKNLPSTNPTVTELLEKIHPLKHRLLTVKEGHNTLYRNRYCTLSEEEASEWAVEPSADFPLSERVRQKIAEYIQVKRIPSIDFLDLNWNIEYTHGNGRNQRTEEHIFTEDEKRFIKKYTGEDRVYAYLRTINLISSEEEKKEETHNSEDPEIEALGQSKKKIKED